MNTKIIPVILALIAGLITCIVSFMNRVSPRKFVMALLAVVLIFLVIGFVWKIILDRSFPPPKEPEDEELLESDAENAEEEEEEASQEPVEIVGDGENENG
ncbi:MAG: hypothetical protein HFI41_10580 [Lachnospiraceae bacterium]|nr:hypothetical protein [Lachnospiraceae bacterium]